MIFQSKPTAVIRAKLAGEEDGSFSIAGVTQGATTLENAAAQINKILAVADKAIVVDGMIRTVTEEGVDE